MPNAFRSFSFSLLVILVALLPGCSMWDSITSYFNTYYNAQRIFDEAENEVWNLPDTRYTGRNYIAVDH
ncbi:MAG: hypothetical protein WBG01_09280, partial [Bacteroidota bacterium]